MVQIRQEIRHLAEIEAVLDRLAARAADLRRPLKSWGVHMVRSVTRTFEAGGRPVQWIPSRRALRTGGRTLILTERLMRSIVSRLTSPTSVAVGTNVRYARVHQLGIDRTVAVPDTVRVVRQAFGRPIPPRQVLFKAHRRVMRIPARPFLVVRDEDVTILRDTLTEHLARLEGSGGRPA